MSDLVEFRHLKYIVAVAETANFTRAAERLFLAQPSLSKQIKDLEDEIGFPIFVRNRDGVRITPAGQMIIAYAQEALAARVEIITMARAVHKGEVAPLRLGFSPFVNPELLEFFRDALCQPLSRLPDPFVRGQFLAYSSAARTGKPRCCASANANRRSGLGNAAISTRSTGSLYANR